MPPGFLFMSRLCSRMGVQDVIDDPRVLTLAYWVNFWRARADDIAIAAIRILLILAAYLIVRPLVFKIIDRLIALPLASSDDEHATRIRKARVLTLRSLTRSVVGFAMAFVAVIMILQAVGYNPVPILATASVAGVAIGFGAQKLVRDVISGFFILMEDQYGVGEYITVGGVTGVVEELGMRITKIRDAVGKLYIIANGDITQVCNHSRGGVVASLDVVVQASADLERAQRVIAEVGESLIQSMPDKVRKPFVCAGLSTIAGSSVSLRVEGEVVPRFQDQVLMALKGRLKEAFAENDIPLA